MSMMKGVFNIYISTSTYRNGTIKIHISLCIDGGWKGEWK